MKKLSMVGLLAAALMALASSARGDGYTPTDSFVVQYGPDCSADDACLFDEYWGIDQPSAGQWILFGTGLALPDIPAPVPGQPFSIITTITDSFAAPPCDGNQSLCDFVYVFGYSFDGQQLQPQDLPDYSVVSASYQTWLSDPPPVSAPEPSTLLMLGLGAGFVLVPLLWGRFVATGRGDDEEEKTDT